MFGGAARGDRRRLDAVARRDARFFERAFDWDADASGRVEIKPGADAAVDAADARLAADDGAGRVVARARATLGGGRDAAAFASANKDTHLVEVPDRLASRVPGTWSREGKRKGFERFDAPDLARLRVERAEAEEARELALAGVLRTLTVAFCADRPRWARAAEAAAARGRARLAGGGGGVGRGDVRGHLHARSPRERRC